MASQWDNFEFDDTWADDDLQFNPETDEIDIPIDELVADQTDFTKEQKEYLQWRGVDPNDPFQIADINTPNQEELDFMKEQKRLNQEMVQRSFTDKKSVADILNIQEEVEEIKQTSHAIRQHEYDKYMFEDMIDYSPRLKRTIEEAKEILRTLPQLAQDQFLSLFKMEPELIDEEEVLKEYRINHRLMKKTMEYKEYNEFSEACTLDYLCSTIGTEVLMQKIVQFIKETLEKQKQEKEEAKKRGEPNPNAQEDGMDFEQYVNLVNDTIDIAQQVQETASQLQNIDDLLNSMGQNNQNLQDMKNQLLMDKTIAQKLMDKLKHEYDRSSPKHETQLRQIVRKAAHQAKTEVNEVRDTIGAWGFDPNDSITRVDINSKREAIERIRRNKSFKKFSKLIGKFRRMAAEEQKRKTKDGATSIKNVQTGGEIIHALPSEMGMLSNKTTRKDLLRRMQQKQVLQYELENTGVSGKGPIIVCIDTSGSMNGTRDEWAKALAIALIEVAQKQRRDFACMHFDTNVAYEWQIKKGHFNPSDVVDIAEYFSGGGTRFRPPLERSLEIIKENRFKQADIVFITDGDSYLENDFIEDFLKIKKQKEFFVRTVLINVGGGGSRGNVERWSDKISKISDLADLDVDDGSDVAKAIFGSV